MKRRGLTLLELLVVLTILISLATIIVPVIGTFGRKSQEVATRENMLRLQELITNKYQPDMNRELPRPNLTLPGSIRVDHPQLRYLFVNPDTEDITTTPGATLLSARRWQGPYVKHSGARYATSVSNTSVSVTFSAAYGVGDLAAGTASGTMSGFGGDPTILDAWGKPVVIQEPSTHGAFTPDATDKTYARLVSAGPNGAIDTPLTVLMPTPEQRGDDILIFLSRHDEFGPDFLKLEP